MVDEKNEKSKIFFFITSSVCKSSGGRGTRERGEKERRRETETERERVSLRVVVFDAFFLSL